MSHRLLTAVFAALALAGCAKPPANPPPAQPASQAATPASTPGEELQARAAALFKPLPAEMASGQHPSTEARVALGRMLYFDTRLSKNQAISCNTCHDLARYGVDGAPTSAGHKGQRGARNSPTVYNAALHIAQFWDGRAKTLEEQAAGPILNPMEMAMPDAATAEKALRGATDYHARFAAAFPGEADPVTLANAARALAAFERTLKTRDRLDDFLGGKLDALSDREAAGLALFLKTGCTTCHNSPTIGGNQFQLLGLVKAWETKDEGRFAVTKNEEDRGKFKVPSLRNAVKTGPYFHDGSVDRLDEAVRKMAWHQLGKELTDDEIASLVAFLGALADRSGPVAPPAR